VEAAHETSLAKAPREPPAGLPVGHVHR
jgi:hypothetical protein